MRKYNLRQVFRFHKLAVRRRDEELAEFMQAVRMAMWAEDKAYKDVVKGLRNVE